VIRLRDLLRMTPRKAGATIAAVTTPPARGAKPAERGLPLSERAPDRPLPGSRDRLMAALSAVGVVFLIPFAVHDFLRQRYLLAGAITIVVATLATDAFAVHRRKTPPIPYALLLVPMAAAITISLRTQGVIGAFWCYPAVLFFHFVLSRWLANLCSIALLVDATLMVHRYLDMRITVRFGVSLALTIVIINVIQGIIRELQGRLLALAITDPLTGAFNRRHMDGRLAEAIHVAGRAGRPVSVLMIDIDHFKRVNDERGHDAGDDVLKGLVSLVKERSRQIDLMFRMGGEEFVLLLPAARLAEELRASIAGAPLLTGRPVTVSIGAAELRPDDTRESWIKRADDALYAAKQAGRNRVARGAAAAAVAG
jgi:diguanylate cyclase (GGDEF)-like protein